MTVRVCVAGIGAFGVKHLEALAQIDEVQVTSIVEPNMEVVRDVAATHHVKHCTGNLEEALKRPDVDAVILCTPTQMHARQAVACLQADKHVLVEIPMADNLADAEQLVEVQQSTGLVAMVNHTRRFNPSHLWIHQRIVVRELVLQHLVVDTFFFRRTNINALGKPRCWTDHLLWHHACHTVDLFQYQTGENADRVFALQGPPHPDLGIAMDMSISLKVPSGALCSLSLSFNNDGPLGSFFRYICDRGTFIARYDDLFDGRDNPIDVSQVAMSNNGIELADREFISAIEHGREPSCSVAQCLPTMRTLDRIEQALSEYKVNPT